MSNSTFNHDYNTRNKNNLQLEKHKTAMYEKGKLYSGQVFYNKLSKSLQDEMNVNIFFKIRSKHI